MGQTADGDGRRRRMPLRRVALLVILASLAWRPAIAACTAQEARDKREIAWDRASLLEMRDLSAGRLLQHRILAMQIAGETRGPNVDWDKVCARYDEITKAAK